MEIDEDRIIKELELSSEEEIVDPRQQHQNRYDIFKFTGIFFYNMSLMFAIAEVYRRQFASELLYNAYLSFMYARPIIIVLYTTMITYFTGIESYDDENRTKMDNMDRVQVGI